MLYPLSSALWAAPPKKRYPRRKKRARILLLLLVCLVFVGFAPAETPVSGGNEDISSYVDEILSGLDFSSFDSFFAGLGEEITGIFRAESFSAQVKNALAGDVAMDFEEMVGTFFSALFVDVRRYLPIFLLIACICLVSGIFFSATSGFSEQSSRQAIHFVTYLSIAFITILCGFEMFRIVRTTIESMKNFLELTFPMVLSMMAASGGLMSTKVFQPLAAVLLGFMTQILTALVFPLFLVINVFTVLECFSESVKLGKFNEFLSSLAKWILGVSFTVFMSFLLIQGITGAVYDGVSVRAAKYTISNTIPIVGGFIKDGFDLVAGSCVLIKNATGVTGLLVIIALVLPPIAKILCFHLGLKLLAGVVEPVCHEKTAGYLSKISKNFSLLLTVLISATFMYFVTLTLFILSSNSVFL